LFNLTNLKAVREISTPFHSKKERTREKITGKRIKVINIAALGRRNR
jgi:hypothetical protein